MEKKTRVYDIECLYNFFCVTFVDRNSDERHHFRIWEKQHDILKLSEFLETEVLGLVGYNSLAYDWPMLSYIHVMRHKFAKMDSEKVARMIHEQSLKILGQKYSGIRNPWIPQLDLFKLWHFDNKNKSVSLKALEIALNWPLVADMPIEPGDYVDTDEKANAVEEYNLNDTLCTKLFLSKSLEEIQLRKDLSELYGLDLMNHNEAKIGEDIILHKIAEAMKTTPEVVKARNTRRATLPLKDCVLPVEFSSPQFKRAYVVFENTTLDTRIREDWEEAKTKQEKDMEEDIYSCIHDGVRYDFGLGGLHGLRRPGVYRSTQEELIISADVSSYYANLAIRKRFRPEHLGDVFGDIYEGVYKERKTHKKGTPANKGLKQVLVSVFGKSKSQWSFLYDPKFTMQITVNGQLLLAYLCEMLTSAGAHIIMANTDGLEFTISREKYDSGIIQRVYAEWEGYTGLMLEHKQYKALFIRDVNNYIGEMTSGETYNKGAYEWEKYDKDGNLALKWEKDHSMLCVPYAVQKYLTRGQPIMQSLQECDATMFFIGKRAKSGGQFEVREVQAEEGKIRYRKYGRTFRYWITKTGGYLFKQEPEAKKASRVDSPWKITPMMDCRQLVLNDMKGIIDYRYYEDEAKTLLKPILNVQTTFL